MQAYTRERRLDSILTVIPIVAIVTLLVGLFGLAFFSDQDYGQHLSLWLVVIGSPLAAYATRRLIQRDRQELGGWVFTITHLLLVTAAYVDFWSLHSHIPYLYAIFIITASLLIGLAASFQTWLLSSIMLLAGLLLSGEFSFANLGAILVPIIINLGLAVVSLLAAIDWQMALESVTELRRRAQDRRDELFEIQETLSLTNAKLRFVNQELDRARQEALRERDLRTRFMNNVSHELRTPLNAVVNFAHILAMGGRGQVTAEQGDYLGRIERSGKHVLDVLNDLLDMAQIESGEFKLYPARVSLHPICEDAMSHVRGLVWDKNVELIRDYPQEWPVIEGDQMRLTQALINLLGNAAKYTDTGHIALRVRPGPVSVVICIEDTGVGIDPQHHELVFQEFRQVDETAARRRMGTGLGLPITRHLIARHGGTIAVQSALGQGSTFTITLPIIPESAPAGVTTA